MKQITKEIGQGIKYGVSISEIKLAGDLHNNVT